MTGGVDGRAANKVLAAVHGEPVFGGNNVEHAKGLGHDFGADAVAGEDENGRIGHGGLPE